MIDIEKEVVAVVQTAVRTQYANQVVYSEYIREPSSFPHVSLMEMDNSNYIPSATSGFTGNHDRLMYQLDVYSNKKNGKKAEAKAIFALADSALLSAGFVRIAKQPVPNLEDSTIYRLVGRYRAIVSKTSTIHPI